jgi:UDP-GlcNAc:undecaprenyl-phosphate/decaprenyl-phosphate GlcNAc-1-phosphate transferase
VRPLPGARPAPDLTPAAIDLALAYLPVLVLAGGAAALASFLLTPLAIRFAPRLGTIDQPGAERRIHKRPIPRSGGLAVALAIVGVGTAGVLANQVFEFAPPLRAVRAQQVIGLFGGVAVGAILGYVDDRYELRARWQFGGQLLLALIAIFSGVLITDMVNPLGGPSLQFLGPAAMVVTTVWVMGMINSANFIDGLDGLLAGIAVIGALTLGVVSLVNPPVQPVVALLCALLAGALLGFLPYNFHPARIFLGTAGVFVIGYSLAVLSVIGSAKIAVALLVLGVPIIDTFWIIVRRLSERRSPFSSDRGHFHHRLLDLGLSHSRAVLVIYGLCIVLAGLSLVLSGRGQLSAFVVIVIIGGVALYLLTRRAAGGLDRSSYPDEPEPDLLADIREVADEPADPPDEPADAPEKPADGASDDPPDDLHRQAAVETVSQKGKT